MDLSLMGNIKIPSTIGLEMFRAIGKGFLLGALLNYLTKGMAQETTWSYYLFTGNMEL